MAGCLKVAVRRAGAAQRRENTSDSAKTKQAARINVQPEGKTSQREESYGEKPHMPTFLYTMYRSPSPLSFFLSGDYLPYMRVILRGPAAGNERTQATTTATTSDSLFFFPCPPWQKQREKEREARAQKVALCLFGMIARVATSVGSLGSGIVGRF